MFITINGKDYNVHIIQSVQKEECALKYNISNGNILIEEFSSNAERDEKYNSILSGEGVEPSPSPSPEPEPSPVPVPTGDYTELKSIIAHGTERISTNLLANDNYSIEAKFQLYPGENYGITNYDWNIINMGGTSVDNDRFGLGGWNGTEETGGIGAGNIQTAPRGVTYYTGDGMQEENVDTVWKLVYDEDNAQYKFYKDGELNFTYPDAEEYPPSYCTYTQPWNIFCQTYVDDYDDSTQYARFFCGKLYYLKIKLGETLIRDYIPVLDSNGVPCLYDRINETFNYNDGTGSLDYETLGGE